LIIGPFSLNDAKKCEKRETARDKGDENMFIVNTASQLEDALNSKAKEVLVTGELAGPVKVACQRKLSNDQIVGVPGSLVEEISLDINEILEMSGVSADERSSMLLLIGDYIAIDTQGEIPTPCVLLKHREKL